MMRPARRKTYRMPRRRLPPAEANILSVAARQKRRLWCKSQSALAFVADSVRERPVSRAFWQKQISTVLFQHNDLHQNRQVSVEKMSESKPSDDASSRIQGTVKTGAAQ